LSGFRLKTPVFDALSAFEGWNAVQPKGAGSVLLCGGNVLAFCCMPTLVIRDVSPELDAELTELAERNRRSKEKQALFLLQTGIRRVRTHEEVLADVNRTASKIKGKITMEETLKFTEAHH